MTTRILVIDDDPHVLQYLADTLGRAGFKADCFTSAVDGLRLFDEVGHELVVTDIPMPEREGIETILAIRRARPATRIVAISGGGRISRLEVLAIARHLGADETLPKPFKPQELVATVRNLLDKELALA